MVDVKPKKVLTEAQRLAFLKGREKRLANIEKRRQEKVEIEVSDVSSEPTESVKPQAKRGRKKKEVQSVEAVKPPPSPPEPEEQDENTENDTGSVMAPMMDESFSEKIADYVYQRIKTLKEEEAKMSAELMSKMSPEKPQKKTKRAYTKKPKPEPKPEPVPEPEPQPQSRHYAPVPQRPFHWM